MLWSMGQSEQGGREVRVNCALFVSGYVSHEARADE